MALSPVGADGGAFKPDVVPVIPDGDEGFAVVGAIGAVVSGLELRGEAGSLLADNTVAAAGPEPVTITSSGGFAPCKLDRVRFVALNVDKPNVITPFVEMVDVTFTVVQVPDVTFPEDPTFVLAKAGALL